MRYTLGFVGVYVLMTTMATPASVSASTGNALAKTGSTITGSTVANTGTALAKTGSTITGSTTTQTGTQTITKATTTKIIITKQNSEVTDGLKDLLKEAKRYPTREAYQGNNVAMYQAMLDYLTYKPADQHGQLIKQFAANLKLMDSKLLKSKYNLSAKGMFEALDGILIMSELDSLLDGVDESSTGSSKKTSPIVNDTIDNRYEIKELSHNKATYMILTMKDRKQLRTATFHLNDETVFSCRWEQCNKVAFNIDKHQVVQIFGTTSREQRVHIPSMKESKKAEKEITESKNKKNIVDTTISTTKKTTTATGTKTALSEEDEFLKSLEKIFDIK